MDDTATRLEDVLHKIAAAAKVAGRSVGDIELVAVSKAHPPESIRSVAEAGQLVFGESRVQEARVKIPQLPSHLRWHFIGHLQRNKIRHSLPLFELFHGIDSLEVAQAMDRIADEAGFFPNILLEVNVSGEGTKFGFSPERLTAQMPDLLALRRIEIIGLMTIAPYVEDKEDARRFFETLRTLRDSIEREAGIKLRHLSMGMSGDYEIAVEEGATLVRVGTAIFGERRAAKAFSEPD